jgi:photosystem II stability/assembly factor-like uncharacterized protein
MIACPRAGTVMSWAENKSKPAANSEQRIGVFALALRCTTRIWVSGFVVELASGTVESILKAGQTSEIMNRMNVQR